MSNETQTSDTRAHAVLAKQLPEERAEMFNQWAADEWHIDVSTLRQFINGYQNMSASAILSDFSVGRYLGVLSLMAGYILRGLPLEEMLASTSMTETPDGTPVLTVDLAHGDTRDLVNDRYLMLWKRWVALAAIDTALNGVGRE